MSQTKVVITCAKLDPAFEKVLADEIEGAWATEIAERVTLYDRGDMPTYDAEDVFAEARLISKGR